MADLSDEALAEYMQSRGERTDTALAEEGRARSDNLHSDRADPTRQYGKEYTPGEREALKTGDMSAYVSEQEAPRRNALYQQAVDEHNARVNWNEYKRHLDGVEQLRRENDALRVDNARKDERLSMFRDAYTGMVEGDQDLVEQARNDTLEFMANNDPPPAGTDNMHPATRAQWVDLRNNAVRDRQDRELQYLRGQEQSRQFEKAYQNAAMMFEAHQPGYLTEVYPMFQRHLMREIALTRPGFSPQQIRAEALHEEMRLVNDCARRGINPHAMIAQSARNRCGISTRAEVETAQRQMREAQAEHRRAQEQAERDAEANYRNQIGNELARRAESVVRLNCAVSVKLIRQLRDAGFISPADAHDKNLIARAFTRAALIGIKMSGHQILA